MVSSWEPINERTMPGDRIAHADVRGNEIVGAPGSHDGSPAVEDDQQAASHQPVPSTKSLPVGFVGISHLIHTIVDTVVVIWLSAFMVGTVDTTSCQNYLVFHFPPY